MIDLEVAVAAPLEQTLTYRLACSDAGSSDDASATDYAGRRVLVPLGRRTITGYILDQSPGAEDKAYTVRQIIRFLDEVPLFHNNIIPFFRWVANYYHYPIGLVIKAALPGGLSPKSYKKIVAKKIPPEISDVFDGNRPDWMDTLMDSHELSTKQSAKLLADSSQRKTVELLVENGTLAIETVLQADRVREKRELCYAPASTVYMPHDGHDDQRDQLVAYKAFIELTSGKKIKFSEAKALYYLYTLFERHNQQPVSVKELRKLYPGASNPLAALAAQKFVIAQKKRVFRTPFGQQHRYYPRPEDLTEEQQKALDQIGPAIRSRQFQPFLLHGVTGCGKTEVYLRAAEETLAIGRDVLMLVPEIALATQLEAQLLSRFGGQVVLLHSGLSAQEKFDQFTLALTGRARVVIGARSAVFAPLADPGLIVVDEEHDASFKQDDSFRYHGRDIGVLRAKIHGGVVILGSATPSITSFGHAKNGKYSLLTMDKRVGNSSLPLVTITDLNSKEAKAAKGIIKPELLAKLQNNLAAKKQSVLLLNRRGFSAVVLCQDCGTPVQCDHCHVSLTLHKGKKRLICHYCGFSTRDNTVCLQCRSPYLVPAGFGTERVEEEVKELLPEARVIRLDSDTASDRKKFLAVLADMHDGRIDILIGTQMIAKGHHFPLVTLVGVVWADAGMSMPDFRAAERTFQLITQVTGRAGRGEAPGEVIIQTMRPDHYAIVFAKDHQYEKMYTRELLLRKNPAFPPYVRLVCLRLQAKTETAVQKAAGCTALFCRQMIKKHDLNIETLGPAPSPLDKIKDQYRYQILLKSSSTEHLHHLCTLLKSEQRRLVTNQCSLAIDVDPEDMM